MRRSAVALGVAALLAGCASSDEIMVAAASDMRPFLDDAVAVWEANGGAPVTTVYGASGQLVHQWQQGAPYDVLMVSDIEMMEGDMRESAVVFAQGQLVVWSPDGSVGLTDLDDMGRVAIAHPDHAPFGRAAMEALTASGMLEAVGPALVYAQSVSQVVVWARTGEVDAALVSAVQVDSSTATIVEPYLYAPLCQAMRVHGDAPDDAYLFTEFWLEYLSQLRDASSLAPAAPTEC